jgi:CheY-like chemotaxis protein
MKRYFVDEERIQFEKDDQELIENLINDTIRISNDMLAGRKDGLEIFDDFFDLQGGILWSDIFSPDQRFLFDIMENDSNVNFNKQQEGKAKKTYNWEDKTILIAEDEETNFLYLKAALSRTGAKILRAKTGKQAVDLVKNSKKIDLILMDIKMPEMNGVDATIEIRSFNHEMKIIAQTAYAMEEDRKLYAQVGCIDYLAKPIHRDLLLSTIARYI